MTALIREAVAAARSQLVPSLLTIVMVAGMCTAALLTTGRTVAAEQAVLAQVDAAGTRTVTVRADARAGLGADLIDQLAAVAAVESATGFGPATDARNQAVPGAAPVAVRQAYGAVGDRALKARPHPAGRTAYASVAAADALGLRDGTGAIVTDDGEPLTVADGLRVPEHLRFLEPLVVVPAGADDRGPVTTLVVRARTAAEVAVVEQVVRGLVVPVDPEGTVTVETSAALAEIRAAVAGELGDHGRGMVLAILVVSAALVAVNLLALVTMRRRDFGRRRALGASRGLIVALLLTQVALLAAVGAALGVAGTLVGLIVTGAPLPGPAFTAAVATASGLVALLAALGPAVVAARRDPLHELRVP